MCMRDRPTLAIKQIGILSVVVGRPGQIIVIVTAQSHPRTTHIPHCEIGAWISAMICASMYPCCLTNASATPYSAEHLATGPSRCRPETVSRNSSPAALILPLPRR